MNLANKITLARILLLPVFILLAALDFPYHDVWAAAVFVIAALTDTLDGYIARSRNLVTTLGKFLDPLADKMLVCSALVVLVAMDRLAAWIVIVIICREFAVSGVRIISAEKGEVVAASFWGKWKTATQMAAIVLLLLLGLPFLDNGFWHTVADILVYSCLILTVISGGDYIIKGAKYFK